MEKQAKHDNLARLSGWPALLGIWKSRLPLIIVPVLAGLQRSREGGLGRYRGSVPSGGLALQVFEVLLLLSIVLGTGRLRLPFSVAWWLVLLAAFALETELLIGVATVLSLSVLLSWYGARLYHPPAVSALWGGSRLKAPNPTGLLLACWCVWDLVVHLLPGALVLHWHGPRVSYSAGFERGTVTPAAVVLALPMNVIWLWGLGLSMPRGREKQRPFLWPLTTQLEDTNAVYRVVPKPPKVAWLWIYGAHWFACTVWLAAALMPAEVLFAYAVFTFFGVIHQPYTASWWAIFVVAVLGRGACPALEGMACCCAGTLLLGFYSAQLLAPHAFRALVRCWVIAPLQERCPSCLSAVARTVAAEPSWFFLLARLGDLCIHLIPSMAAMCLYWGRVTPAVALAALPSNLLWLFGARGCSPADSNRVYGVEPDLPGLVWWLIYASHWVGCATTALACFAFQQQVH